MSGHPKDAIEKLSLAEPVRWKTMRKCSVRYTLTQELLIITHKEVLVKAYSYVLKSRWGLRLADVQAEAFYWATVATSHWNFRIHCYLGFHWSALVVHSVACRGCMGMVEIGLFLVPCISEIQFPKRPWKARGESEIYLENEQKTLWKILKLH